MTPESSKIITIDGPAGSGKSTISQALAAKLGFTYLDTGAMYRAVGLQTTLAGIDLDDEEKLADLLENLELQLRPGKDGVTVLLDQQDVSNRIRTPECGMMASKVSALPLVRKKLTKLQQHIGQQGGVVVEGRDMGTVVFPAAKYKFYLDASPEERARRRTKQLQEKNIEAEYDEILRQTIKRDHDDSTRLLAPLKPADDAVIIDSSKMTITEVINFIFNKIETKMTSP